jgi:uncharacterized protein YggE
MGDLRQMVTTAALCVLVVGGYAALQGGGTARAVTVAPVPTSGALQPFLRFTGSGHVTLRPDRAMIDFSTHATGTTLAAAQQAASAAMQRLIARMRADGVAAIDLRTEDVSGGAVYQSPGTYEASQNLSVRVLDVGRTGRLLADGAAAGATAVSGPSFSVTHQRAAYAAAVRAAVADARSKADAAAAAAGLHVTGVVSVNEQGNTPVFARSLAFDAAARPAAVPVKRGTQQFDATLTVVFSYG